MIFEPIGNRVLVRRLPQKQKGLIIPIHDEKAGSTMLLVEGEVLAVGPECEEARAGQKVMFNARWNDFAAGELEGSDCDRKGPLERPAPQWQWMAPPGVSTKPTKDMHLITEGDIAGILQ